MNAEESLGRLDREDLRNDCPPVTALRNVLLIAQLQHQFVKRGGHPGGTPAARLRIAREAVARHCRKDEVEGIVGASAVRSEERRVGKEGVGTCRSRGSPAR